RHAEAGRGGRARGAGHSGAGGVPAAVVTVPARQLAGAGSGLHGVAGRAGAVQRVRHSPAGCGGAAWRSGRGRSGPGSGADLRRVGDRYRRLSGAALRRVRHAPAPKIRPIVSAVLRAGRMAESLDDKPRLSGARGDFVASLGRRLQTLRAALGALEEQPADRARRNALLRRVHALGAAARVLGFASVAEALAEAGRAIGSSTQAARPADLAEVSRVLDVVPSLVGGAAPSLRPPGPTPPPGGLGGRQWPLSILLFGNEELERSLMSAVQPESVEVER